ncbi:hypothetical protein AB6T38_09355 [Aliiglaciecola sp. SL4]|uniref:hypothetical protein n=1 Tax=Aliiglaciecola sp. SL4 TaxID=3239806 RepID=UPI00355BD914
MYKEVTLDPDCFNDFSYYILLQNSFGPEKGRFLSVSKRNWIQETFQIVKNSQLGEVKKKSIKHFLNKLQKDKTQNVILLNDSRQLVGKEQVQKWLDWHKVQHAFAPFDLIISERLEQHFWSNGTFNDNENWVVPPSKLVRRDANEYLKQLVPILNFSKSIFLVDPYIPIPNNDFVKSLITQSQKLGVKQITIFTSINNPDFQNVLKKISKEITVNITFKVVVVRSKFSVIHDRYLFSECAAIKSSHGFTEKATTGELTDNTSFSLVGKDEIDLVRNRLQLFEKENVDCVYSLE